MNLTNSEIIECCIVVDHFMKVGDSEYLKLGRFDTPSNTNMNFTLKKYGYDMISFTNDLSKKFNFEYDNDDPKNFFSDDYKISIFSEIVRKLKLEIIDEVSSLS